MITRCDGVTYRVTDAHAHIYKEKIAAKASAAIGDFYEANSYDVQMWEDHPVPEVLRMRGAQAGIDQFLVFSVATTAHQVGGINSFIAKACAQYPEFVGLGTAHPESEDFEAVVEDVLDKQLLGIKLHPDMQRFNIDDPGMMPLYRAAEQADIVMLFHVGDERFDFSNPLRLARVIEAYPRLRIHAAHLGCCRIWEQRPLVLAAESLKGARLMFDSSSMLGWAPLEAVREVIDCIGYDRVMWGTDFPMWSPQAELDRLFALGYSAEENAAMLYDNFARFYRITKD